MQKTLLVEQSANDIITRAKKLTPDSQRQWGEMSVTEMLLHCNLCNRQILEEDRGGRKTTVGQFLLRILALYIALHFKKGIQTEAHNNTSGKIDVSRFEEQQQAFITLIQQFPAHLRPMTLTHPAFGNISTREWGIAAYKHMDHHLRQFGV